MTVIEIFPWNKNFETGILIIDQQHKGLVDLLNLLVSHLAYQSDSPTLNLIFDELKKYTNNHFSTEEKIWLEYFYNDPWMEWHKHAHIDFIEEILKIKNEDPSRLLDDIIEDIVKFLTHWLAFHILDSDKRMAKVVLALPTGISLAKAKIQADEEMLGTTRILIDTIMNMYDKLANRTVQMTREINKRKEIEVELKLAKEKAESANIAKSTFISTMSHELRTPLNAILGFSELLSNDPAISSKQKEMLDIINTSGTNLLSLINDVLDISKIEAGKLELHVHDVNLTHLFKEIGDLFSGHASKKQIYFQLQIDFNLTPCVVIDDTKFRQMIINLLGNAIKFTPPNGTVSLQASTKPLPNHHVMLCIKVNDTGTGIAPETQDDIFKPFFQSVSKNFDEKGTGLGLAIVKSFVTLMEGSIFVFSDKGKGSSFQIELPVPISDQDKLDILSVPKQIQHIVPNQNPPKLLVVDDNSEQRLLLKIILTDAGFQVNEATNGQEAVDMFEQWQPDLIWMDLDMPVLNGYNATKKIRQLIGGDKVKIIAVTANTLIEDHLKSNLQIFDSVVYKPFHVSDIPPILTEHLNIQFMYQDISQEVSISKNSSPLDLELTSKELAILPLALREQLHDAAIKLDVDEINFIVNEIYVLSPEIAHAVKKLSDSYQLKTIIELTELIPDQNNLNPR